MSRVMGSQPPLNQDGDLQSRLTQFITEKWVDLKSAYWMYHSWIWGSLLMYAGELWIEYSIDRRLYQRQVPKDDFVPTPRINKFAPTIDAIASNFQQVPEIEAVPTPMDDFEKMGIAEVCNELAQHFLKSAGLRSDFANEQSKAGLAGQLLTLAGCFLTNVYVKHKPMGQQPILIDQPGFELQCTACDSYQKFLPEPPEACPNCGNPDVLVNPTTTQIAQPDENGNPMMEPVQEAEVCCEIENALFLYPRPGAKSMQGVGWFFIAERLGLDDIWSRYGLDDIRQDTEYPDGWNTTNENALNFFYLGYSNYALSAKDGAMIIRAYCEPGQIKDYPEGFYAIYVNGECKKVEPWTFPDHPLTKCDFKPIPTLIFPRSAAFDLAPLQKEKGDFWSMFKLHGLTSAVAPWIIDADAQVSEITGRADKIIKYRKLSPDTQAPHHALAGQLDPDLYRLDDKIDAEFDRVGQTVAVWKGENPSDVKSGVALQTLRSQAEFMFSGPTGNWNSCWKETTRKAVKLMQKQYTLQQLVAIAGENRISEIQQFQQCDLDTAVEWVATKSGLPRTRDERRQEMVELFDRGLLDMNDPEVKQKAFELFGETGILTTFNKDATRARMENALMKQGGDPIFMPEIDDNQTHLAIHGEDIKSSDFLKRPPEVQQKAIMHYMETKQALAAQLAALQPPAPPAGEARPRQAEASNEGAPPQ